MKKNLLLFLAIVILGSFAVFAQDPAVTMDSCTNITFAQVKFYGNLVNKGTWTVNLYIPKTLCRPRVTER